MEQGNLTEQAISIIKNAIVMGELKLGEAISEIGICNRYKLSKTPVREALVILSHEGLVNKVSRKGCFVFDITLSEIEEIAELRYLLEEFAVNKSLKNNKEDRRLVKEYCERNSDYRHTVKPIWKKCCGALERYNVIIKKNKDPLWKQRLKS